MSIGIETLGFEGDQPEPQPHSLEERVLLAAQEFELEPTQAEIDAITGMIRGKQATTKEEIDLRFDIVCSKHRAEGRTTYDPRHLSLLGILKYVRRDDD